MQEVGISETSTVSAVSRAELAGRIFDAFGEPIPSQNIQIVLSSSRLTNTKIPPDLKGSID